VVARHLDAWGHIVQVIWFAERAQLRGDARVQWEVLDRSGIDQKFWEGAVDAAALAQRLRGAGWLVDALLGTGLARPVTGTLKIVIEAMNQSGKPILAIDLPSGLDADTGQPLGIAVHATVTATFVGPKIGFLAPGASSYTGEVAVIEIGVPRRVLEPFWVP
jgi:NAD(P)H-hydrate epimerase